METLVAALAFVLPLVLFAGMLPMRPVRLQLGVLLAADATTLAPASSANQFATIVAAFTPNENLVPADLTLGTTNGLGPILCATGAQEVAVDAVSGAQIITIVPGAGTGFRWVTSGSFTGPITVFGYALLDNALTTLLAVQQLPVPITVTEAGLQIDADPVQLVFVETPIS